MTLRTSTIAFAAVLVSTVSACAATSETVEVPGASTTAATTEPPTTTAPTTTGPTVVTELPTPTPPPSAEVAPTTDAAPSMAGPTGTDAPTTQTAPPTTEAVPVTTRVRNPDFLRQGDEGSRVGLIQFKLVALGYLPAGGDTGVFDSATNGAVLAFQGDYGLIVDGVIGPETERAISAAAESINPEQQ